MEPLKPPHIKMAEMMFNNGKPGGVHSSVADKLMGAEHWEKLAGAVGEKPPGAFQRRQTIGHLKNLEDAKDVLGELPASG